MFTFPVKDMDRKLFAIKMMLSCDDEPNLCYCTRVMQFQETTQWKNSEILSANTTGHVLTILEVPCFKSHMVKISATIMCKMESEPFKELQLYVPPYELNAEDVAKNLNTTFSKHEDIEDVLSVLAASEKIMLTAKWQRAEIQLQDVLVTKLNFVDQTGVGYFYNSGKETPGLAGIMVEMVQQTDTDYTINVFSRNAQQLYLFVSMVYDVVPLDTVAFLLAEKPKVGCDMLREAFSEELKLVKGLMPEDAMACDSDDVVISCDRYSSFRKQFSCLELSTDMLASGNYLPDV